MIARFFRDNGLTIVLLAAFFVSVAGMTVAGLSFENEQLREHGAAQLTLFAYLGSAAFQSALFENWESEFLQMGAYVMLTAILFQRGSAESRDPDAPFRPGDELPAAAGPGKSLAGGSMRMGSVWPSRHCSCSVSCCTGLPASRRRTTRRCAMVAGAVGASTYLGSPHLWFESFQNWQSEFLATAVLVVLSIFLRFRGSPESKALKDAHGDTGA